MNEIADIWAIFFGVFCIVAMPSVFIFYFVNLWLNKRNPEREERTLNKPLSKFGKFIRTLAGGLLIILGLILLAWPFFAINILKEPSYLEIDLSENFLSSVTKIISYFSMVIVFISAGFFYLRTGITDKNEKATSENIRL